MSKEGGKTFIENIDEYLSLLANWERFLEQEQELSIKEKIAKFGCLKILILQKWKDVTDREELLATYI